MVYDRRRMENVVFDQHSAHEDGLGRECESEGMLSKPLTVSGGSHRYITQKIDHAQIVYEHIVHHLELIHIL